MSEQLPKLSKKQFKIQEQKRTSSSPKDHSSRKQHRKGENPIRIPPATELCEDVKCSNSWICKNAACRATISIDDTFCKRCSCCICHLFDDNKDPSLWLECTSESGQGGSCGLTCHIECALQREKVGVVDLGQLMQLDGSYCCASCGKVSGILGFWKKQLCVAKDARRVDILCYRIYLSYRLLDGTSRFKELHEIVKEAKAKLEIEVGPVNGVSSKMARGIVSRLSIASDIQSLCSIAIEKSDEWLATKTNKPSNSSEGSLPAACKFLFEEVTSTSVVIVLIEVSAESSEDIKGYKLWYCKAREDTYTQEPVCVFPRTQRRILISNLQPCTEYSFRIVSYTDTSDVGHSEAKCFTKSIEIIHRKSNSVAGHKRKVNQDTGGSSGSKEGYYTGKDIEFDSGFKVRDLGKILRLAWAQQQGCLEGFCGPPFAKCCESCSTVKPEPVQEERKPSTSRQLDLNVASVPDLNEELTPSSRDEDNGCTLGQTVEAIDDATSHDNERNGLAGSHGSGDSQNWNQGKNGDVSAVGSQMEDFRKRGTSNNREAHDSDSTLVNGSPIRICTGGLDENFADILVLSDENALPRLDFGGQSHRMRAKGDDEQELQEQDQQEQDQDDEQDEDEPLLAPALLESYNEWRRHLSARFEEDAAVSPNSGPPPLTLLLDKRPLEFDVEKNRVILGDGTEVRYERCLVASAGRPKHFYVLDSDRVSYALKDRVNTCTTHADFVRLDQLAAGGAEEGGAMQSALVIGAGFLGCEVACALATDPRNDRLKTKLVFVEQAPAARSLPPYLADELARRLSRAGVEVVPDKLVTSLRPSVDDDDNENDSGVSVGVLGKDNPEASLDADYVILASTHTDPAPSLRMGRSTRAGGGLERDEKNGGLVVNSQLEAVSGLFVAGNAASYYDPYLGRRRVDRYDHAVNSGLTAGRNMARSLRGAGKMKTYRHQPLFRSHLPGVGVLIEGIGEVDSSLRTVGVWVQPPNINAGNAGRGMPYERGVVYYLKGNKIMGILLWNASDVLESARQLMLSRPEIRDNVIEELKHTISLAPNEWLHVVST